MSEKAVAETKGQDLAQAGESANIISVIERAAKDPNVDPDKMERMFALYERVEAKRAEQQFAEAMSRAQSEMGRIAADANNPQTRSRYATYAALDRVLRPVYSRHGFSLSFDTDESPKEHHVRVLCYVSHIGGHTRTHKADMAADGKGAKGGDVMTKTHAEGSAMSYGMRYLLKLIFNVAVGEDDDDGNRAGATAEPVSEDQALNIHAKLEETGSDTARFLKALGRRFSCPDVRRVEDIPATIYGDAIQMIENNAKRKGGGQ